MDGTKLPAITASEAQADPGKWAESIKQISAGKSMVVKIPAGEKVPLKITMTLPIATLVSGENHVLFTRDTYLFISSKVFRISPDGQRWADIYDLKAQKKLFEFKKGTASMGFHGTEKEGFKIFVDMKAQ